jgi:osmotically-inducible protein OsmY
VVRNQDAKLFAEELVEAVPGVGEVYNHLAVKS